MASSLILLMLLVAVTFTELSAKLITLQLSYQGQSLNVANAGLIDGLGWFLRQSTQPATAFTPSHNLTATPPVDDTDVNTTPVSIQRDFLISAPGKVWGHYELTSGSMTTSGSGAATVATGVYDLTQARRGSAAGSGMVWQLDSLGVVYVRNDTTKAYNQSPNFILARRTLRSEISRFAINAPAAAITIQNCANAKVGTSGNTNARVVGGANGAGVNCISGSPSVQSGAVLSGTPSSSTGLTTASFSMANVFGLNTLSDYAAIADINVTSAAGMPSTLPAMQMILINAGSGTAVNFTTTNPLQGSGILVVVGNLSLAGASNWNGIIYVQGNFTITDPATVDGTIILANSANTATLAAAGDWAEVYYDPFILQQVQQQIGQYRFSRSAYVPCANPVTDPLCRQRLSGNREFGF
jgi:hypothetical protein